MCGPPQNRYRGAQLFGPLADSGRDMANAEAAGLASADRAAETLKCFQKEGLDVVGLQPKGLVSLHIGANLLDLGQIECVGSQGLCLY